MAVWKSLKVFKSFLCFNFCCRTAENFSSLNTQFTPPQLKHTTDTQINARTFQQQHLILFNYSRRPKNQFQKCCEIKVTKSKLLRQRCVRAEPMLLLAELYRRHHRGQHSVNKCLNKLRGGKNPISSLANNCTESLSCKFFPIKPDGQEGHSVESNFI